MLFNLCLHLKTVYITSALAVAVAVLLLSMVKEKIDERKRV